MTMKLQWPTVCKTITQAYGNPSPRYVSGRHTGIDIGCINGSPIRASHDGKVTHAGWNGPYGNQVRITAGNIETWYNHLSKIVIRKGQNVSAGMLLGYEGSTGQSTGPHLHLELRINGKHTDPMPYLKGQDIVPAGNTVSPAGSVFEIPGKIIEFFKLLSSGNTWIRLGMILGGILLVVIALVGLAKVQALGKQGMRKVVKSAKSTGSRTS